MIVYKIRVNYKSGKSEEFECSEFEANQNTKAVSGKPYGTKWPLLINMDEVESIWRISGREVADD